MAQSMRAFEIRLNGKKVCLAGVGKGILAVTVNWVARPKPSHEIGGFAVGGIIDATEQQVEWASQRLRIGDELRIKVVEKGAVDTPRKRKGKRLAPNPK
jgi:hypothetical protein